MIELTSLNELMLIKQVHQHNMNNNRKNNILILENVRQKRLTIMEYFDAYICHHYRPKRFGSKYSRIFSFFFSDIF